MPLDDSVAPISYATDPDPSCRARIAITRMLAPSAGPPAIRGQFPERFTLHELTSTSVSAMRLPSWRQGMLPREACTVADLLAIRPPVSSMRTKN